jgi:hypothetical protein
LLLRQGLSEAAEELHSKGLCIAEGQGAKRRGSQYITDYALASHHNLIGSRGPELALKSRLM